MADGLPLPCALTCGDLDGAHTLGPAGPSREGLNEDQGTPLASPPTGWQPLEHSPARRNVPVSSGPVSGGEQPCAPAAPSPCSRQHPRLPTAAFRGRGAGGHKETRPFHSNDRSGNPLSPTPESHLALIPAHGKFSCSPAGFTDLAKWRSFSPVIAKQE